MLKATLRGMLAHKIRVVLTSLSIALGVAFLSGTLVMTDTMGKAFDSLFTSLSDGTDVAVRSTTALPDSQNAMERKPFAANVLDGVRQVPGVAGAEGFVSGYAMLIGSDGKAIEPKGAPMVGVSFHDDESLNKTITLSSGRAPQADNEVVIDRKSADDNGIGVGTPVRVVFEDNAESFQVVGVLEFDGQPSLGGATVAAFDLPTAQRVMGRTGRYDAIHVKAADGVDDTVLRDRIRAVVPTDVEALTGQALADESSKTVRESLGFLNKALMIFAGVALFVGSFIIWNTFSILVTQRSRETALLRAVGATRRQVLRSVLAEAGIVGVVSSAIGIGLGFVVAIGLTSLLSAFGMEMPSTDPQLQVRTIVISLLVGTIITLFAAVAPARKATKVAPVAALRDAVPGSYVFSRVRLVTGVVVLAGGLSALFAGLYGGAGAGLIGLGILLTFMGVTTMSPLIARPLARFIGAPLPRIAGKTGSLARQNAMRNPKRTSSTAAALMIGLGLVATISVFASSLKASVGDIVDRTITADVMMEPTNKQSKGMSLDVAKIAAADPDTKVVSELTWGEAKFDGGSTFFTAVDEKTVERVLELDVASGSVAKLNDSGVLVSKLKADAQGWKVGDPVSATFAQTGDTTLHISAIFEEKGYVGSDYLISLAGYDKHHEQRLDNSVLLEVRDGADIDAVRARLGTAIAGYPGIDVHDAEALKSAQGATIDQFLALITALLLLAVLIALLGIVNTLALSVFERTRELGLLRAVGMTKRQVRAMVRWESVIISIIGASLGALVGIGFGIALTKALADQGITQVAVPGVQLAIYIVLAGVAGVLAAIGPARSAAKVDVLRAVVTD